MSHTQDKLHLKGALVDGDRYTNPKSIPVISHMYPVDVHHPDKNIKCQIQDLKDPKVRMKDPIRKLKFHR